MNQENPDKAAHVEKLTELLVQINNITQNMDDIQAEKDETINEQLRLADMLSHETETRLYLFDQNLILKKRIQKNLGVISGLHGFVKEVFKKVDDILRLTPNPIPLTKPTAYKAVAGD